VGDRGTTCKSFCRSSFSSTRAILEWRRLVPQTCSRELLCFESLRPSRRLLIVSPTRICWGQARPTGQTLPECGARKKIWSPSVTLARPLSVRARAQVRDQSDELSPMRSSDHRRGASLRALGTDSRPSGRSTNRTPKSKHPRSDPSREWTLTRDPLVCKPAATATCPATEDPTTRPSQITTARTWCHRWAESRFSRAEWRPNWVQSTRVRSCTPRWPRSATHRFGSDVAGPTALL
jgi:hypothetical protein